MWLAGKLQPSLVASSCVVLDVVVAGGILKLEEFSAVCENLVAAVVRRPIVVWHRCSSPGVTGHLCRCEVLIVIAAGRRWTVVRPSQLVCWVITAEYVVVVGLVFSGWRETQGGGALRRRRRVQWCYRVNMTLTAHTSFTQVSLLVQPVLASLFILRS